ncbi:Crp/Fnr family transcriptional regulator [Conexibacter arvalis]|uniref:CRP-like cAMP-binding protein n=1 Tax=Conexibacter arvalis TaxID=912552 RepID=A0A840IDF5_9ACTN|nr:Crp/Fnr family transcriptional regulator [Conexibacter arvalis]MBB4662281.1 CRP-like cAMP-binding protein [Conexibacter arvalis]
MSLPREEQAVRLLDEDPDLAERLAPERRAEARVRLLARAVRLPRGPLAPAALDRDASSLHGLLLLDGLVSRNVRLADTTTVQLLGRGDLLEPGTDALGGRLVPIDVAWVVLEPGRALPVDDAFVERVLRWPEVVAALFERIAAQSARQGTQCAISGLARVEDRIETLMWFLAERWGRIGSQGVVLPLRLTHETLGQMLGARRSTVTLALRQLAADGLVQRRDDGAWLLLVPSGDEVGVADRRGGGVRFLEGDLALPPERDAPAPTAPASRPAREALPVAGALDRLEARIERMLAVHARMRARTASASAPSSRDGASG